MRDAVRNKKRWKGAVRLPKILVLTDELAEHLLREDEAGAAFQHGLVGHHDAQQILGDLQLHAALGDLRREEGLQGFARLPF